MRWLLAFLSTLFLAIATLSVAAAAPPRDWSATTTRLPSGAMLIGNPAAPVKLIEYGSYTCSHCANFSVESSPVLKGEMIRSGKVSLEYRHLIRDRLDLAAALLARCGGTARFADASETIFALQPMWLQQAAQWAPKHPDVEAQPPLKQARTLADASGLTALMLKHGLTPAQVTACFANAKEADVITKLTANAPADVRYTPTFFLNGTIVPNADWASLEPILRARIGQ